MKKTPKSARTSLILFLANLSLSLSLSLMQAAPSLAARRDPTPEFPSCEPVSDFSVDTHRSGNVRIESKLPSLDFCAQWNPEFGHNGGHCCAKVTFSKRRNRSNRRAQCAAHLRVSGGYCHEKTPEQMEYEKEVQAGLIPDVLQRISWETGRHGDQSFCTVNNGFLAYGRPIVPTDKNRIVLRSADRCTNFGTDSMAAMVEWLGRQTAATYSSPEYAGVRLVLGDVSAPRGGCLGHLSHTSGQDADIGFLTPKPGHKSPIEFHRNFDPKANWWFIKQVFKNPYACVRVVFLDRGHIRKLVREAGKEKDPEWLVLRRFIRHMPGHKNHMHVRIGDGPGPAGCRADARPELEDGDDAGADETDVDLEKDLESDIQQELSQPPLSQPAPIPAAVVKPAPTSPARQ